MINKKLIFFSLLAASFLTNCVSPPRLGLKYNTPMEDGVHVMLHPSLNLSHYNETSKKTTNNPNTSNHVLIEPGEQVIGVYTAYTKSIWAFYSKVHDVTINGNPGESFIVCSLKLREKGNRSESGGTVMLETRVDLIKLTPDQKSKIYVNDKVQVDYLKSLCPME